MIHLNDYRRTPAGYTYSESAYMLRADAKRFRKVAVKASERCAMAILLGDEPASIDVSCVRFYGRYAGRLMAMADELDSGKLPGAFL